MLAAEAPLDRRKQQFGRIGMAEARGRTQRRHVREKATIDHLVREVYEPQAPDERHTEHSPPRLPACRSRIRSGAADWPWFDR